MLRSETLVRSKLRNTFSLPRLISPMRSSRLSNAAAISDTTLLVAGGGGTRNLASHGTDWATADTSGDIAAHLRKMASGAAAVAAATSATMPVMSLRGHLSFFHRHPLEAGALWESVYGAYTYSNSTLIEVGSFSPRESRHLSF